ncbi:N-6 DNA methylase [Chryseobacterium sp. T20]|uniref:class I SAM-dependent DNA methyltransferase n=1 Tax=Chryseobacterium sp. T20 TaxID=3395375 RepID=UPI0039BCBF74
MSNVNSIIKTIRDLMRRDSGVDGDAQRISQLVWMLFLKIFSDKERYWLKKHIDYNSPLPLKYKWTNWVNNDNFSADELINFVNDDLFPTLKNLKQNDEQAQIIRSVFGDTYNFMRNGLLLKQVATEIDKIDFSSANDAHIFNEIYETILKELQNAGTSGEFYTPRALTQFMVDMLDPQYNEKVLDPACGTGGFLTCTIENLKKNVADIDYKIIQRTILGVEKKPLPHLLCTTNLILHGIEAPQIFRGNYLAKSFDEWREEDHVDKILSNPPFGGLEEDGTEKNFPIEFRTKETADLFVLLIIELLKEGGSAAIILPDNFLFGEGVRTRLKEKLLTECNLHTIVRLPKGVFSPYTSVKTNLLFFQKGSPTKEIWYYEHQFPEGQSSYSKSKPIVIEDFEAEMKWWNNRIESDNSWKVMIDDIIKRGYDLDISSPYFEEKEYVSSDELRTRLEKSFKKSEELLNLLKLEFND